MSARTHPAVRGFDIAADTYERGHPGYPAEAVAHLATALRVPSRGLLVEIGSGTGKLTRALQEWPVQRLAVEPTPAMRTTFHRVLPSAPLIAGTAEAIPLRDGCADAVVVAQAFHWFRQPEALDEIARVLRPDGALGLLWNVRDESVPWMARLGEIINAESGGIPRIRSGAWRSAFVDHPGFAALEEQRFSQLQAADIDTVVDRVLSVSAIALLPPAGRRSIEVAVRSLLAEDPATAGRSVVDLPYQTSVYIARRRPP